MKCEIKKKKTKTDKQEHRAIFKIDQMRILRMPHNISRQ